MSERNKRKSLSISQKLHLINTIDAYPFKRKALIAEELEVPFSTVCNVWRDISGRKDGRKENRGDAEKKEGGGKTRDRERQTKRRADEAARSGEEEKEGNNELSGQKVGGNGKGEWMNMAGGKDGRKEGEEENCNREIRGGIDGFIRKDDTEVRIHNKGRRRSGSSKGTDGWLQWRRGWRRDERRKGKMGWKSKTLWG